MLGSINESPRSLKLKRPATGFFWLNTQGVTAELAAVISSPGLGSLLENREPMLVVVDGEEERIRAASRTRVTSALIDAMLLGGVGHDGETGVEQESVAE